jgi:hypothetical protein
MFSATCELVGAVGIEITVKLQIDRVYAALTPRTPPPIITEYYCARSPQFFLIYCGEIHLSVDERFR